ncbi:pyrroloquinoline quinone-dependent dehydrogenase [Pendulispora brunnea]|uniref:Pyrroloquinoline quinone-dependent dehydrogenase n=1 Tax=Pendulispora brunnea TaxID=2905690 RepID=A0ABZ2KQ58_9BACT
MRWRRLRALAFAGALPAVAGWSCRSSDDVGSRTGLADGLASAVPEDDWPAYGRDLGGARFSPLSQVNRHNVAQLEAAWTYQTGDVANGTTPPNTTTFQSTPIYVFGTLYLSTGFDRVIALDPDTGREKWSFNPQLDVNVHYVPSMTSRGVASWEDAAASNETACRRRIFVATLDARLIALDALSGLPCASFGQAGTLDLKQGISDVVPGQYGMTSPPTVVNGVVVVGSMVQDGIGTRVPEGVVRGFDARTGARRWSWDPIPRRRSDEGNDAWSPEDAQRARAANVWSIITADPERDLVFLPTSSPAPDYYGGLRKGPGPHANSVVALRASTGQFVWAFQVVHHDIWDYDIAAAPALLDVPRDGRKVAAVAVGTKNGHLFVLDRDLGKPVFPVEERLVPPSDVPGEEASRTQPFPVATPNLTGETRVTPADAFGLTPVDLAACQATIATSRAEGMFTPPSIQGTLMFPGPLGGVNWGGLATDAQNGLLITSVNRFPYVVRLIPRDKPYVRLPGEEIAEQAGTPYRLGRRALLGPVFPLPCTKPPWGKLVAIDVRTGAIRWDVPIGRIPGTELIPGSDHWGSMLLGGPIVTAGGLVFIAGTMDNVLRAVDSASGQELWHAALPTGGQATPMTYRSPKGRQFVVIAAGGSVFLASKPGDTLTAFALPEP